MALVLILYSAVLVLVTVFVRKHYGVQYTIKNKTISWWLIAATYASTTYSAFMILGLVDLSFKTGIGALIFEGSYLLGTVFFLFLVGRRMIQKSSTFSTSSIFELLEIKYGSMTNKIGVLVASIALVPYMSVQFIGVINAFESLGQSIAVSVVLCGLVVILTSLLGGIRGVAVTDAIQGALMLGVAIVFVIALTDDFTGSKVVLNFQEFPNSFWNLTMFVNLTLPWIFFSLTNPQVLERMLMLKSNKDLYRMLGLFFTFGATYTLLMCFTGFYGRGIADADLLVSNGRNVVISLLQFVGPTMSLFVVLSIFSASLSTSNSMILTLSTSYSNSMRKYLGDRIDLTKIFVVVISVTSLVFAITNSSMVVDLSVLSSKILLVFLPLVLSVAFGNDSMKYRYAGVATLIVGLISAFVYSNFVHMYSSVLTFVSVFVIYFVASKVEQHFFLMNLTNSDNGHEG